MRRREFILGGAATAWSVTARAQQGEPQYPHLLDSYVKKPTWQVAGVNFYVGCPAGPLKDPRIDFAQGGPRFGEMQYNAGQKRFYPVTGFTADGYDFNTGGPYLVDGSYGGNGMTFRNCDMGQTTVSARSGSANWDHCSWDMKGAFGSAIIDTTYAPAGTKISITNCVFQRWHQHLVELMGSIDGYTFKNNLCVDGGWGLVDGSHLNYLQWGCRGTTVCDVSYNTCIQHVSPNGGEMFQFYGGTIQSCNYGNNVLIAYPNSAGAKSISTFVNIGWVAANDRNGDKLTITIHDNYYDTTGLLSAVYSNGGNSKPPNMIVVSRTGDFNMVTGAAI